ncbi:hypothetical protein K0M31_019696 [Melipona bicolor]|uniref:Uncharacterized protein n=1 Tax=Melipona bicolor TaxID=60889 RepID=A0AA40G3J3_9HYME|nr:hypothetical protein K0M31_019696 [Melipona bicolor]
MQGYQRNFDDQQKDHREDETIVVDIIPPQYQLSPPHSPPPGNIPKTPEKGENLGMKIFLKNTKDIYLPR